jgi:hypothetical protein
MMAAKEGKERIGPCPAPQNKEFALSRTRRSGSSCNTIINIINNSHSIQLTR